MQRQRYLSASNHSFALVLIICMLLGFSPVLRSSIPTVVEAEEAVCDAKAGTCQQLNSDDSFFSQFLSNNPTAAAISDESDCKDLHELCAGWASIGECSANPNYMLFHCKKSCDVCSAETILDSYGEPQDTRGAKTKEVLEVIEKTERYMKEEVIKAKFDSVRSECKNRHTLCAFWAVSGECEANPAWMTINCAPSCQTCHLIDINTRCPLDPNATDVFQPGDLNQMFKRIVAHASESADYELQILSRPSHPPDQINNGADYQLGPWVITLDNFVSEEECERLIHLGAEEGYNRSMDVGKLKFDGTYEDLKSESRTSENAWCKSACSNDPITKDVMNRIVNWTGIPEPNFEQFQLLKYEVGQFYQVHHDFIEHQVRRPPGPRILTVFLYLNDVEAGGGTNFPRLNNLTVMPKRGRALIWPSVLNENLNMWDEQTYHQALPVEKGRKYGANSWLHLRDFQTSNNQGCA